jgi:hypothetical protein
VVNTNTTITGSTVISGSLTVSGSTNIIGTTGNTLLTSNADTLVFTGSLYTSGSIISTGSLSINGGITGSLLGTASYAAQALTASNANTASSADNFTVRGTLTAQTINVQTITSSVDFVTGSSINGSLLTNNHQFTGSVDITGSLAVNGRNYINDSSSFASRITTNSSSFASFSGSYVSESSSFASRIATNSSSFSTFSGSYVSESSSLADRITTNSSSFTNFSGSYINESSSFASRVTTNSSSFASFSGSYISESSSFAGRVTTNSSSFANFSGSYVSESSSFAGRVTTNSSSFANFSGSYVNESSSFAGRVTTNSSSFASFSGSYVNESSSFASRIATNSSSFASFSGSYTNESSSFASRITTNSSSFANFSGSYINESSSFDSRINNISSSLGSISASLGSLSGSFSTGSFTGSFTGSLLGTASYATQALSASYAATSSHAPNYLPLAGGTMTGDIYAAGRAFTFQDLLLGAGTTFGKITTDGSKYISIMPTYNVESARFWANGNVTIQDAGTYVDNGFRLDVSGSGRFTDGLTVTGSLQAINGITGSLKGTASYAANADLLDGKDSTIFATTSSNTFIGDQTVTGSISMLDVGSSLVIEGNAFGQSSFSSPNGAIILTPGLYGVQINGANPDLTVNGNITNTGANSSLTGSLLGTASFSNNTTSASNAATASSADNLTVRGTLTAQTIVAQTITSSIDFVTGSTRNGSELTNTHQFTGSVGITGSLAINGIDYTTTSGSVSTRLTDLEVFSGSYSTGSFTGSFIGRHTGSFSGSLYNLQNSVLGHIPFFSASQVLADSVVRQLDNGSGSYSVVINQDDITTAAPEALYVWQPSDTSFNVIAGKGNLNSYLQLNIQNLNTGENASSDVVATANNGNESINYIDMGINSEGFTGSIGDANDAYLYSTGNHLHIGNASNQYVGFFAGGHDVDTNMKLILDPNNSHEMTGSLSITNKLVVLGGVTASLQGTASWANSALNANSASNAVTASLALNANNAANAATASYVIQAQSASYWSGSIINAATASYVENAKTASFVLNAVSASYIATASYALFVDGISNGTASLASTASYVQNAQSASYVLNAVSSSYAANADLLDGKDSTIFATTGSNIFVGNQTITGSFAVSGSTTQIGNNTLSGSITVTGSVNAKADINLGGVLRLDPATDPGSANLTSSFLFTSASNTATGYDLYYRQGSNNVKFKWFEGVLNTGILYGGVLTYSSSYFYVSSGSGIIVNHNAATGSEISPTITYVNWAASTHSISTPTAQNTYVFIDANGDVQQQTSFFTPEQYHEALPIGRVSHYGTTGSTVTGVGNNILTSYDVPQQLGEFARAFGPLKISGFTITPQVGNLSLNIGSGTAFNLGGYYQNTPDLPSSYNSNTYVTSSIIRIHRSGSGFLFDNNGGAYYTSVDPLVYDDGTGTLNTVGSGNWSIQRVFVNPITGRSHVYYGQSIYTTYLNAVQSVATDDFIESEVTKNAYVFAGYLVMKGGAANDDLSVGGTTNAIIQSGLFRNSVGGSGGAATAVSDLNDLSDVNISSPSNGQALIYSTGTWINGTPISSSYAATASFINGISNGTASFANTASFAQNTISASYAATASSADNFTVRGTLTAQTINVQTITSSIEFNTGSTRNGSTTANTHEFTGSVLMTGSLVVNGNITGSSLTLSGGDTGSITSPSAGTITISAGQAVSQLNFGGNTSLFPSLLRNAASISFRNGSNNGFTGFTALSAAFTGTADSNISNAGGYTQTGANLNTLTGPLSASNATFNGRVTSTNGFTGSLQGTATNATTASYALTALSSSFATTASYVLTANSSSNALTASFINPLVQNVIITGSLMVGTVFPSSISNENTLTLGPPPSGGTGEGGQLLLQASGGLYTSASMLDNWQNQFRILRGTNASSDDNLFRVNLQNGQVIFPKYTGSGAFPGTAAASLGVDTNGNIITLSVGTVASASYAATSSYANDFTVANTLTIDQTLTDYHTVPSSAPGENNMFNRVTGSYSSGFFKYTVSNGANARTGEVMAVWNGGAIQYTDNSTVDIGDTSAVTASAVIVSNAIQFNITTATSGWKLKSLGTFM